MPENTTPEEKLLRIIESPASDLKAVKRPIKAFNFLSFNGLKARINQILSQKEKFKPIFFSIKFINQAMIVLSLIVTAYFVFDFIKGRPDLDRIKALGLSATVRSQKIKTVQEAKILNLSDYLSQIEKRDIFHFVPIKKEEKPPQAKEAMMSLAGNLKLVGIIWSKNPQAMIEDKKENKTLLVSPGDSIGAIKVKQILRDKVVIGYEDQEMELM